MKQNEEITEIEYETNQSMSGISPGELTIGTLAGIDEQGSPLVNFPGNPLKNPLVAVTTVGVNQHQTGRQVALLFANSNLRNPVIIGLIHSPLHDLISNYQDQDQEGSNDRHESKQTESKVEDVYIDGKRLVIEGHEEIVLKCGDSSITLTKAGKILIRGKYLLNRSSGVNRIMGGSVQVN